VYHALKRYYKGPTRFEPAAAAKTGFIFKELENAGFEQTHG
jgi:hypothetical protein